MRALKLVVTAAVVGWVVALAVTGAPVMAAGTAVAWLYPMAMMWNPDAVLGD